MSRGIGSARRNSLRAASLSSVENRSLLLSTTLKRSGSSVLRSMVRTAYRPTALLLPISILHSFRNTRYQLEFLLTGLDILILLGSVVTILLLLLLRLLVRLKLYVPSETFHP